jgi:hypothetical protein
MDDRAYFLKRATAEREAAIRSTDMAGFRAHMDLVREYEHRASDRALFNWPDRRCADAPSRRVENG